MLKVGAFPVVFSIALLAGCVPESSDLVTYASADGNDLLLFRAGKAFGGTLPRLDQEAAENWANVRLTSNETGICMRIGRGPPIFGIPAQRQVGSTINCEGYVFIVTRCYPSEINVECERSLISRNSINENMPIIIGQEFIYSMCKGVVSIRFFDDSVADHPPFGSSLELRGSRGVGLAPSSGC